MTGGLRSRARARLCVISQQKFTREKKIKMQIRVHDPQRDNRQREIGTGNSSEDHCKPIRSSRFEFAVLQAPSRRAVATIAETAAAVLSTGAETSHNNLHCSNVACTGLFNAAVGKLNMPELAPPLRATGNTKAPDATLVMACSDTEGPPSTTTYTSPSLAKMSDVSSKCLPTGTSSPAPKPLDSPTGTRFQRLGPSAQCSAKARWTPSIPQVTSNVLCKMDRRMEAARALTSSVVSGCVWQVPPDTHTIRRRPASPRNSCTLLLTDDSSSLEETFDAGGCVSQYTERPRKRMKVSRAEMSNFMFQSGPKQRVSWLGVGV